MGDGKSKSMSSGGRSDGSEDRVEENIPSMVKNSYASVAEGSEGYSGSGGNRKKKNSKNVEISDIAGFQETQSVRNQNGWDYSMQVEHCTTQPIGARDTTEAPFL